MEHFAGLDVSVKETSVCIVDDIRGFLTQLGPPRRKAPKAPFYWSE